MRYVASRTEMQQIDAYSIEALGIPGIVLMEKAAMAMEEEILRRFSKEMRILIIAEKGNNGGDGLALGRLLIHHGYTVDLYEIGAIPKASASYTTQKNILENLKIPVLTQMPEEEYDVVVDAIFGVGLTREVAGKHREVIEKVNKSEAYRIALDVPSGVDASSGLVLGVAFQADLTITVGLEKVGLLLHPGAQYAGEIVTKDIGFPKQAVEYVGPKALVYEDHDIALLPKRKAWSNKGTYGRILLVAGSVNMAGAAYLSALAAYKSGAGLVRILTSEENRIILQSRLPEAILTTYKDKNDALNKLEEAISWADVIGFGPGLGVNETGAVMLECVLTHSKKPLILDADGINILAKMKKNQDHNERARRICTLYAEYESGIILTPHMKEMERLSGVKIQDIIENRIATAKSMADAGHIIVLKDARTIVSDGSAMVYINLSGNHGMAVAGSGDVLLGILSAFAAVEKDLVKVARLGVFCHGKAGDLMAARTGYHSMMATDLADGLRLLLQKMV